MRFRIPELFNITEFLEKAKLSKESHEIETYYLLNSITQCTRQEEFRYLARRFIERVVHPRKLKPIKKALFEQGIIMTDGRWRRPIKGHPGSGKALGYRLTSKFRGLIKYVEVDEDNNVVQKIKHQYDLKIKFMLRNDLCDQLLFWLGKLEINVDDWNQLKDLNPDMLNLGEEIRLHEGSLIRDKKGNRVHTSVTRLISRARKCLRINGEKLVEIDIANSQPWFFTLSMKKIILSSEGLNSDKTNFSAKNEMETFKEENKTIISIPLPPSYTIPKKVSISDDIILNQNELDWIEKVQNGNLYDFLYEKLTTPNLKKKLMVLADRKHSSIQKEWKEKCFKHIFFGRIMTKDPIQQEFAIAFPTFYKIIRQEKLKDYRDFACVMQRLEAFYVIDEICSEIIKDHPEIPLITVHDSIMTTPSHIDYVKSVMEKYLDWNGFKATVRIK